MRISKFAASFALLIWGNAAMAGSAPSPCSLMVNNAPTLIIASDDDRLIVTTPEIMKINSIKLKNKPITIKTKIVKNKIRRTIYFGSDEYVSDHYISDKLITSYDDPRNPKRLNFIFNNSISPSKGNELIKITISANYNDTPKIHQNLVGFGDGDADGTATAFDINLCLKGYADRGRPACGS